MRRLWTVIGVFACTVELSGARLTCWADAHAAPVWNLPSADHAQFVPPHAPHRPVQLYNAPSDTAYGLIALPINTSASASPASLSSATKRPVPRASQSRLPTMTSPSMTPPPPTQHGSVHLATSIGVLPVSGSRGETLFNDMSHWVATSVATALTPYVSPPAQLIDPSESMDLAAWLANYAETRHLQPLPVSGQQIGQVLLIQGSVHTQQMRQPVTAISRLRWLASDTMPNTLQYQLVAEARLIDSATGRLTWQTVVRVPMRHDQLVSLNRTVNRVSGNQLVLQQAADEAGRQITEAYRWAHYPGANPVVAKTWQKTWGHIKQWPTTVKRQLVVE